MSKFFGQMGMISYLRWGSIKDFMVGCHYSMECFRYLGMRWNHNRIFHNWPRTFYPDYVQCESVPEQLHIALAWQTTRVTLSDCHHCSFYWPTKSAFGRDIAPKTSKLCHPAWGGQANPFGGELIQEQHALGCQEKEGKVIVQVDGPPSQKQGGY